MKQKSDFLLVSEVATIFFISRALSDAPSKHKRSGFAAEKSVQLAFSYKPLKDSENDC